MGLSSVEATNVLRICAVSAMRSDLLDLLPLLAGLRRLDAVLADVFEPFELVAEAEPVFDFVLLVELDFPLDDFFVAADAPEDFCPWELCPVSVDVANTRADAAIGSTEPRRKCRRNRSFISSLYLYLCLLDA